MSDAFPSGWSKTLADLFAESKVQGSTVGPPESEWAIAYERSLLRNWARFPLNGEIYEALEDTQVNYLTHWTGPFTGGDVAIIPGCTRVRVSVASFNPEPISVTAQPLEAAGLENLLVPERDRAKSAYSGFSLSITTSTLNKRFRRVT